MKQSENLYNRVNLTFSRLIYYVNQKYKDNKTENLSNQNFSDSEFSSHSLDFNTQSLITTQSTNPSFELFKTPPFIFQEKIELQKNNEKRNLKQYLNENKSSFVVNHAAFIQMSVSQKAQIEKYYQKRKKQNKK